METDQSRQEETRRAASRGSTRSDGQRPREPLRVPPLLVRETGCDTATRSASQLHADPLEGSSPVSGAPPESGRLAGTVCPDSVRPRPSRACGKRASHRGRQATEIRQDPAQPWREIWESQDSGNWRNWKSGGRFQVGAGKRALASLAFTPTDKQTPVCKGRPCPHPHQPHTQGHSVPLARGAVHDGEDASR